MPRLTARDFMETTAAILETTYESLIKLSHTLLVKFPLGHAIFWVYILCLPRLWTYLFPVSYPKSMWDIDSYDVNWRFNRTAHSLRLPRMPYVGEWSPDSTVPLRPLYLPFGTSKGTAPVNTRNGDIGDAVVGVPKKIEVGAIKGVVPKTGVVSKTTAPADGNRGKAVPEAKDSRAKYAGRISNKFASAKAAFFGKGAALGASTTPTVFKTNIVTRERGNPRALRNYSP